MLAKKRLGIFTKKDEEEEDAGYKRRDIFTKKSDEEEDAGFEEDLKRLRYDEVGKLNVFSKPRIDETIAKEDFHTYLPFTLNSNHNDSICIEVKGTDLVTATYASYIHIKGTYEVADPTKAYSFANNAACFLFEEIQYRLGSNQIIDTCKQPGITASIKGYISYDEDDTRRFSCTTWNPNNDESKQQVFQDGHFSCIIPLSHIFGFCEDYRRAIINMPQQLMLIRSKSDINCYKSRETEVKFTLTRISWEVPHLKIADDPEEKLLDRLHRSPSILLPFRKWELHELPAFSTSKLQVWRVKNSNELEKPRWIAIALQKNKMDVKDAYPTDFTHSSLINVKVVLNTKEFPQQRMNLDFAQNDYIVAFLNYCSFRANYYGKRQEAYRSLFDYKRFKECPIFVIDCSRQEEALKSSTVDIRVDFESAVNFDSNTKAYCLILHDTIYEYNPFTEFVSRYIPE